MVKSIGVLVGGVAIDSASGAVVGIYFVYCEVFVFFVMCPVHVYSQFGVLTLGIFLTLFSYAGFIHFLFIFNVISSCF
jgi:hypothetical protein